MNFFKTFWAALLAFVVINILIGVLSIMVVAGIAASLGETPQAVKSNSILKIDLSGSITDSPSASPFGAIDFMNMKVNTSNTILEALTAIEGAATDDNIKGIYINLQHTGSINAANIEELRSALLTFKESGKFVVSYNEVYSQFGYFLSSVADRVYLSPAGSVSWQGLAGSVMFYKGLLDKLGIQPEVIRHGTFKAAVEPFILDKMSPENRLQMMTLYNSIWGTVLSDVAASRSIDSATLSTYASELALKSAAQAKNLNFVDSLIYEDQMMDILGRLADGDKLSDIDAVRVVTDSTAEKADIDEPEFISLSRYISAAKPAVKKISKNKVAIVYADGTIVDGNSEEGKIGGATMAAKLAKVRKDKNIKALVLRINSPGGSALASEVMWREIELIRKDKPVVVSMSGVAASGGYYIACPADIVLANRMTITGSIGVFGLLYNAEKGLKDKLGITVDVAKTNPSADMGSPFRPMSSAEKAYLMYSVEDIYKTFVGHVADGRNLTFEAVDAIGGGRVWSGVSASQNGLIDGFGGLKQAIALAADRAAVSTDYRVSQIVDDEDQFTALFKSIASARTSAIKSELGEAYLHYNNIMEILEQNGTVQARMPYVFEIQ